MRVWVINIAVMTVWACVGFGASNQWVVLPCRPVAREIELPALAIIDSRDDTALTWRLTGRIPFTRQQANKEFTECLRRQQWMMDKSISIGDSRKGSELLLFRNGSRRLLLMLWESRIGETGFALGEEPSGGGSRDGVVKAPVFDKEKMR